MNINERQELETFIYEGHKDAFGRKGRHYNFDAMSIEELRAEADWISGEVVKAIAEEEAAEERALADFKKEVETVIGYGAEDRETALRWMTDGETFYHGQCVEQWVWERGILFTDYGRNLVKELMGIVTFEEMDL